MSKLYLQGEVAKVVGLSHQSISYAIARGWIKVYGKTGRDHFLFTEKAINDYAALRKLSPDFGRLES